MAEYIQCVRDLVFMRMAFSVCGHAAYAHRMPAPDHPGNSRDCARSVQKQRIARAILLIACCPENIFR
ncbi:hypothetical protein HF319_08300 [Xanthomonas sp. Kuri4-1]